MIIKGKTFGVSTSVTFAEFGKGDILISPAFDLENKVFMCCFKNSEKENAIGEGFPEYKGKPVKEIETDIIFSFTNPKSIDVVIGALEEVKKRLIAAQK